MSIMRVEFNNVDAWKAAIWCLVSENVDFSSGNSENPFIIIYDTSQFKKMCYDL